MKTDPRSRAGKRSANRNAGKPLEDGMPEEGGIVAEAEKELAAVETPEAETPTETPEAEAAEPAAEEAAETPEVEAAEHAAEPIIEPEAEPAVEETPEAEPAAEEAMPDNSVGDYQAPEGESHDELLDKYHEALSFGDTETAKALYKQLRQHQFAEDVHRAKTDARYAADETAYLATAKELATAHPELAEDGLEANKVLALSDLYRQEGMMASDALRKAVSDLYPEEVTPAPEEVEEILAPEVEEIPAPEEEAMMPDMSERIANKQKIQAVPSASAKNEPEPPAPAPTRESAIEAMKRKRGQS